MYISRGKLPNLLLISLFISLSLSMLFENLPALRDTHEAPHHAAVFEDPPACSASHLRCLLESSRIELLFWGAWPAASSVGARPVECSALSNKPSSLLCTPTFGSSFGHCSQTPALPRAMPAAPSTGARPGALRSPTRGWLQLYSPPSRFLGRLWGLRSLQWAAFI